MKKKFFTVLSLLLAMLFAFCACSTQGTPPEPDQGQTGEGGGQNDPDKKPGTQDEYRLPLEDGKKQLTIYYFRAAGYADCDIWMWYGDVAGQGYLMHDCAYGAKVVINVPESITQVGFIIRTGCSDPGGTSWGTATKDGTDSDRFVSLKERETVIYTKAGDAKSYLSDDGGLTLKEMKNIDIADLQDLTHIKYVLSTTANITEADVSLKDGEGKSVAIKSVKSNNANGVIETETLDLSKAYTLSIAGFEEPVAVVPLTYFSSAEFAEAYNYDGELGVKIADGKTSFFLWAPTAASVKLNLFAAGKGGSAEKTVDMTRGEKGVWTYTENANLSGKYYTYTVSTSAGVQEAVDPYAVSAGVNGDRGMILDLDTTDPVGWTEEVFVPENFDHYTDAEIWEVHVRDFSNRISQSKYKGKFLAFTETGLKENGIPVGVDHLKELGITHVHLLPSFDYATVDEEADTGFNWGYDPKNYNVPEGSYSTDPTDGAVRVREFKQMVQALHEQGIGVVMDVVYNHTSGLDSNFNRIVPYYYYRFNGDGTASNGSGCGNETASDRYMFSRFMVDSVTYWQEEYNVDGFRFDLMGLHDVATMQKIETAVHAKNPHALLYGEGWTGGTSTLPASNQSVLANLRKLNESVGGDSKNHTDGVAMFSDVIRDAIKGSVFDINDVGFATGAKAGASQAIRFGVNGGVNDTAFGTKNANGWQSYNPTNVVNYASAHDNNTLWDRICHVYGEEADTLQERLAYNRLSAAIVQTSLGIPFMQAGEEMLRQKKNADGSYNENSYNASDEVNNLRWELLSESSEQYKMMRYYQGLIALRKKFAVLRSATTAGQGYNVCNLVKAEGALLVFTMTNPVNAKEQLLIVYNAEKTEKEIELPAGEWALYADGTQASITPIVNDLTNKQKISPISCYIFSKI